MIQGNKAMRIKKYLFIDRCAEGFGYCVPEDGEELIGLPFGWCAEDSPPFIEHRRNGKVVQTVNCTDVAMIIFEVE